MLIREIISVIVFLCLLAPAVPLAFDIRRESEYSYFVFESNFGFTVHGREVTPEGQNVYVEFHFYSVNSACEEEVNSFCRDNLLLLENGTGKAYEPTSVHITVNQTLFETARLFVEYKYEGDFAGGCTLALKSGGPRVLPNRDRCCARRPRCLHGAQRPFNGPTKARPGGYGLFYGPRFVLLARRGPDLVLLRRLR
jgi:hypothetical protein